MAKVYNRINFLNSITTPLGATNMNKMDKGIDDLDNKIEAINVYTALPSVVGSVAIDLPAVFNNLIVEVSNLSGNTICFSYNFNIGQLTSATKDYYQGGYATASSNNKCIVRVNKTQCVLMSVYNGGVAVTSTYTTTVYYN